MRIFALETNIEKIKDKYLCEGEKVLHMTRYHPVSFFFAIIREILITTTLFVIGIAAWWLRAPMAYVVGGLFLLWVFFVFFNFLKAYIDWKYDCIFITTDRVILLDQTSIFHHKVNPINIENIGSVSAETQFWGIFPFGIVVMSLKEGEGGGKLILRYVPDAPLVAAKISEVVTAFQRSIQNHEALRGTQRRREEEA